MIIPLGELAPHFDTKKISDASEMDAHDNMDRLRESGPLGGARELADEHFAVRLDVHRPWSENDANQLFCGWGLTDG